MFGGEGDEDVAFLGRGDHRVVGGELAGEVGMGVRWGWRGYDELGEWKG